jgi:hypothetical protein
VSPTAEIVNVPSGVGVVVATGSVPDAVAVVLVLEAADPARDVEESSRLETT